MAETTSYGGTGVAASSLPTAVKYIKCGEGSCWWKVSRDESQVHAGWGDIPDNLLTQGNLTEIEAHLRRRYPPGRSGFTQDFNQLKALLGRPSQYVWTTIEAGDLWWCTVRDGLTVNPESDYRDRGHFWLQCDLPWNNRSLGGRQLLISSLPGAIAATRGFRATLCTPEASPQILRAIRDEPDEEAHAAAAARLIYEGAIVRLLRRLHPKDFELLVDLILSRAGWTRIATVGGVTEGTDIEAENAATGELAFVQVKGKAGQATLADYVRRFNERSAYQRMIFAVHTPQGRLEPPIDHRIQVWDGERIAELAVKLGLADWIASRI